MGSNWSSMEREPSPDPWWPTTQSPPSTTCSAEDKEVTEGAQRGRVRQEELEIFKQELARKRALRHEALAALQAEMRELRRRVEEESSLRLQAEQERDLLKSCTVEQLEQEKEEKKKLLEEKERLTEEVEEKAGLQRQVQALKDVSQIGKEMLRIRELQVKELKKKLVEINLASIMAPPEDLRVEYETQIENIRKLRTLYEERAAATLVEHRRELEREEARREVLETKLSDLQKESEELREAKTELEEKVDKLESTIKHNENELETTKDDLFSSTIQNKSLNSQMTLINNLFSHMLVSPKMDLDRLNRLLKENHGLITDLTAKGDSNEVAALLVDLAGQVEKEQPADEKQEKDITLEDKNVEPESDISTNLTKVWKVMMELLSHHQTPSHTELAGGAESCYKCIQTPAGPRSVISVSQTFLTLKDLILEKNRLVKEVGRLKTLNNHLEHRLGNQEKRLSVVTTELRKTWGVVNKLKAQHKQLHTHEKILRYELQQKRCMLTELKQELENCRDKWEQARQKNTQTEEDWKKLRKEFAARKLRKESNSAESGYEEEDVAQSPPSEPINNGGDLFEIKHNEGCEPELSEEDIEHSDGNSFDTVIDLLDIACLENQNETESAIPFVLCDIPPATANIPSNLLPLTSGEFTDGLDQIESEDLAAVLDIQYQNQLLGADYNLSLPSSSGSSPIPTENDDFASSEMDVSEEDSLLNENHIYSSPLPTAIQAVSEDTLLFGSNSSRNISKFLDGLFVEQYTENIPIISQNLLLIVPSTSQTVDETDTATPLVNDDSCYQFPDKNTTPVNNDNCYAFPVNMEKPLVNNATNEEESSEMERKQDRVTDSQTLPNDKRCGKGYICECNLTEDSLAASPSSQLEGHTREETINIREDRLKRLEKQCRSLVSKVTSKSFRSEIISNKLDALHKGYGSFEVASDVEEDLIPKESRDENNGLKEHIELNTASALEDASSKSISAYKTASISDVVVPSSSKTEQLADSSRPVPKRTQEEILEARAARLKRLEDQCKSLFSKMSATSSRSEMISNKLDELHGSYGSHEENQEKLSNASILSEARQISAENVETQNMKLNDSKPLELAAESKQILNNCSQSGPSVEPIEISTDSKKERTPEEILEARAERFKRLEEQCKSLVSKMTATSLRGEIISNKLDELHSCYGSSEDVSDNDEQSSSFRESERRRSTPTSSPRYIRRMVRLAQKDKQMDMTDAQINENVNGESNTERVIPSQSSNPGQEAATSTPDTASLDRLKRTPEEILQARAQRLNRLEEQCKTLFNKMSATSQRSDVISNRLEELHEQFGQPSTSEQQTTLPAMNSDVDKHKAGTVEHHNITIAQSREDIDNNSTASTCQNETSCRNEKEGKTD